MTLAEFIEARLGDAEQAATQGGINGARWDFTGPNCEVRIREPDGDLGSIVARCREGRAIDMSNTIHIAYNDPARVLRQVAAIRAILAEHPPRPLRGIEADSCRLCRLPYPCPTVRAVISVWSDHPDYDARWKP